MKVVFVLCVVAVTVMLVQGGDIEKGVPYTPCPQGQHPVVCPGPEPTCDNPTPTPESKPKPSYCVCISCNCDSPTIRDTKTGKCVNPVDCS